MGLWENVISYSFEELKAAEMYNLDGHPLYVWMALVFLTSLSCWIQAIVTEERFVPALNVITKRFNIPDDVAGATLMGAALNAPEFFSCVISIFVTKSSLGLGTVLGSMIFNQLCICSGSVFSAKDQTLPLNRAVCVRDIACYLTSILLLCYALSDHRPDPDDPDGPDHFFISLNKALCMCAFYMFYVVLLARFDIIMDYVNNKVALKECGDDASEVVTVITASSTTSYGAVDKDEKEDVNVEKQQATVTVIPDLEEGAKDVVLEPTKDIAEQQHNFHGGHRITDIPKDASALGKLTHCLLYQLKFIMEATLPDVHAAEGDDLGVALSASMSCLIWLGVGSYVMVRCLEAMAAYLKISEVVIGGTASAIGTSLPNYIASMIAAERGLGNMAVCNAFGSNIFYLLVALGFTWLLYIVAVNGGRPYHALVDVGVYESVVYAFGILIVHAVLMVQSGFVLRGWHGHVLNLLYMCYFAYIVVSGSKS